MAWRHLRASSPPSSVREAAASPRGTAPKDDGGVGQVMQSAKAVDLALQCGDAQALPEHAKLSGAGSLYFTAFMLILDVFLDMNSINTMLLSADILFAGCLAATVAWSMTCEIASGNLRALPGEFRETRATGVPTEGWLKFLDRERGTEALVSLLISTYGLPFATRTSVQMMLGCLSVATSSWSLATFIHEYVDLAVEESSI
mmetsp:Transcript_84994/g.197637  ORF Transcript_84994/g.197637 Transcript_84994/m.197637 type:complete len:202 (+) Transcript_84994:2-607(+)